MQSVIHAVCRADSLFVNSIVDGVFTFIAASVSHCARATGSHAMLRRFSACRCFRLPYSDPGTGTRIMGRTFPMRTCHHRQGSLFTTGVSGISRYWFRGLSHVRGVIGLLDMDAKSIAWHLFSICLEEYGMLFHTQHV